MIVLGAEVKVGHDDRDFHARNQQTRSRKNKGTMSRELHAIDEKEKNTSRNGKLFELVHEEHDHQKPEDVVKLVKPNGGPIGKSKVRRMNG